MEASVVWEHELTFTGAAESGLQVPLSASPEPGHEREGFSPMELVLVGLAGCTGMDVISILRKQRQDVAGFEVKVQAERAAEHPRVFTHIEVEYVVRGRAIRETALQKAIVLSETKYCSALAMLGKAVPIRHHYRIVAE